MKANIDIVLVTFRVSNEDLTSMFSVQFSSVNEAKSFIEEDAEHFCEMNKGAKIVGWNKETDHYEVKLSRGRKMFYQYFKIGL